MKKKCIFCNSCLRIKDRWYTENSDIISVYYCFLCKTTHYWSVCKQTWVSKDDALKGVVAYANR